MRNIFFLLLLLVVWGCLGKKTDTKVEGEKLMQLSREWSKSAATDSVAKTLSYWADDAVVMSPANATVENTNAVEAIKQRANSPRKDVEFRCSRRREEKPTRLAAGASNSCRLGARTALSACCSRRVGNLRTRLSALRRHGSADSLGTRKLLSAALPQRPACFILFWPERRFATGFGRTEG